MSLHLIAVATDGSDNATHAVEWVAQLAAQIHARVVAIHVFQPLEHITDTPPPVDFEDLKHKTRTRFVSEWCTPLANRDIEFEPVLVEGDPPQAILDTANRYDADLIVTGARGLSTLRSLLVGSTTHKLTHLSQRPVTIVPHPAPD